VPFVSYAVIDEDLTTGQNPAWGRKLHPRLRHSCWIPDRPHMPRSAQAPLKISPGHVTV
jgi:hypothetical protein